MGVGFGVLIAFFARPWWLGVFPIALGAICIAVGFWILTGEREIAAIPPWQPAVEHCAACGAALNDAGSPCPSCGALQ